MKTLKQPKPNVRTKAQRAIKSQISTLEINPNKMTLKLTKPLTIKPNLNNLLLGYVNGIGRRKCLNGLTSLSVIQKDSVKVSLLISENGIFDLFVSGVKSSKFTLTTETFKTLIRGLDNQDVLSDFLKHVTSGRLDVHGGTVNEQVSLTVNVTPKTRRK